jgi:hypothetical protein
MAEQPTHSFWTTLPGVLTALAALVTAVGGTIGGLAATSAGPFSHPSRAPVADSSPNPTPPPPTPGGQAIDPCVVGTWQAVDEQMVVNAPTTPGGPKLIALKGSGGAFLTIRSDGTDRWDFSTDSPLKGTISGAAGTFHAVLAKRGTVTARVTSVGHGIFHETDIVSSYTEQWTINQTRHKPSSPPWRQDLPYTCSDTRLTLDNGAATTWHRP